MSLMSCKNKEETTVTEIRLLKEKIVRKKVWGRLVDHGKEVQFHFKYSKEPL